MRSLLSVAVLIFALVCPVHAEESARPDVDFRSILLTVYETNPSLVAARAELHAVHERYPQAMAGWRPNVDMDGSIYKSKIENSNFGNASGTLTKEFNFNVEQPLFRGGRTTAELEQADTMIKAAYALMLQKEQSVFMDTIIATADIVRDRTLLFLRNKNEVVLTEELSGAKKRFELGELTVTDTKQAEARLARAVSERLKAKSNLERSIARFEEVAGYPAPDNIKMPELIFEFPDTLEAMLEQVDQNNLQIQEAVFLEQAATKEVDVVFRELMPQISAFATLNKQYDPQPGIVDDAQTTTLGLRASIALYQGGRTRSRVREKKNLAYQRKAQIDEVRRTVRQMATGHWNKFEATWAEIVYRDAEIEAASVARDGVREEARMGERTILDILDADQELLNAQASLVAAERDQVIEHFSLASDIGRLLPEYMNLGDVAYDPGPHSREMRRKIFSMEAPTPEEAFEKEQGYEDFTLSENAASEPVVVVPVEAIEDNQ